MRILLILLIAGLCLVTAKYIPHETSSTNSVLYRVRRADHDSDSNTASVERDDDSSNDNDNDDGDDNDLQEKKIKEEQTKLREKEENKKQKLLEKIEKEKQKEIEEKRKQEEKLAKEKRKEEERKEKEERKLTERIEKEKHKVEEETKKMEQKLVKEERKRQEKLKKQVEKIHKDQIDSAEDGYLETEEEDSVEIEDIWKAHVYDKYGISITSTKIERQAALQRYLQEEMGINANSTKSERRQAIIKLIQTKLQNDSATVDSFRNLLLSHVNAAQIQKLRSKLENDLEELDNQTVLLNNLSHPWASVAQQNIEEKRTFLQTIAQFLSNIVPNWFTGDQSSGNPNQLNGNEITSSSATPTDSDVSNIASGSGQSSQPTSSNDSGSLNNGVACGESNLSVLPNNVDSVSSSNNPSKPNGLLGSDSLNNNAPVSQTEVNELPPNSGNSANVDSPNASAPPEPGLPTNQSQSNLSGGSGSLNHNVPVSGANGNGPPSNTGSLSDSEPLNIPASENPVLSPSHPSEQNGSSDSVNNNTPVIQTNGNGLLPSNSDNTVSSDTLNASASTGLELTSGNSFKPVAGSQNNVNGSPLNIVNSANVDSSNVPTLSGSGLSISNPSEPNLPGGSGSVNNNIPVSETNANGLPSNTGSLSNSESSHTSVPENSGLSSSNPSGLNEGGNSLNNDVPVSQPAGNGPSNNGNTVISDLLNGLASTDSGSTPGNPLDHSGSASSSSIHNNVPANQNDVNGLPSDTTDSVNTEATNVPAPSGPGLSTDKVSESNLSGGSGSLNTNVPISETNGDGLPSSTTSANSDSSNVPATENLGLSSINPSESLGSGSLNNNVPSDQSDVNGHSPTTDSSANFDSSDSAALIASGSSLGNQLESIGSDSSSSLNNNVPVSQTDGNGLSSNADNSANVVSTNLPASTGTVASPSNPDLNESVGSDPISNNVSVTTTDVNGLGPNTDSVSSDSLNTPASTGSVFTPDNQQEPNGPISSTSLNNGIPVSLNNVNELPSSSDNSANLDSSNVPAPVGSESSSSNPSNDVTSPGSVNISGDNAPLSDVANDQIEELVILAEAAAPSASESSNATPLTGSEQTPGNPESSTVFGDNISVDNNVAVNSSTSDDKHGVYIESSDVNAVNSSNSENGGNVPTETIVGTNIAEAANSDIVSTVASFSNKSVVQGSDVPVGSTDVSINADSELGETTVSSVAVYDILTSAGTEPISSVAAISGLSNSNGNDEINSANVGNIGSNDFTSNPETVTNIISTDTQAVDQTLISLDTSIINTEATNDIVEENVNAEGQNKYFLTTPVAEADEIITRVDAQTEPAVLGVQEIVNTPSDLVTEASVQPPPSLPPHLGVDIPNEDAASIVDIKLN